MASNWAFIDQRVNTRDYNTKVNRCRYHKTIGLNHETTLVLPKTITTTPYNPTFFYGNQWRDIDTENSQLCFNHLYYVSPAIMAIKIQDTRWIKVRIQGKNTCNDAKHAWIKIFKEDIHQLVLKYCLLSTSRESYGQYCALHLHSLHPAVGGRGATEFRIFTVANT